MTAIEPRTRFARIVRRVAGVIGDMNYSQRRATELFLGLDERR